MTSDQTKPATIEIHTPKCPRCGSAMHLERIEPERPQYDRRTFRCDRCGESTSQTVKYL